METWDAQLSSLCVHDRSVLLDEQHGAAASASWLSRCNSTSASVLQDERWERQKNVIKPPQTLTEVTSSVSEQTKKFNLRKINNCLNARIILPVLLPGALFFPVRNKFSFSLCWIWKQLYPLKLSWIWTLLFFCNELRLEYFAEMTLWWLDWRIAVMGVHSTNLRFTTQSLGIPDQPNSGISWYIKYLLLQGSPLSFLD